MIILTKSFEKQLKSSKIEINEIVKAIDRVLNKKIFRKGDTLLPNSFVKLKNCLVVKTRVGGRDEARMLVLFIIINNIKIPLFIARKNNKKFGSNISLKNAKKDIKEISNKSLECFNNGKYEKINE